MDILGTRKIVSADRLNEGLVILFDDGRCALYSSAVLYEALPQCEELKQTDLNW